MSWPLANSAVGQCTHTLLKTQETFGPVSDNRIQKSLMTDQTWIFAAL